MNWKSWGVGLVVVLVALGFGGCSQSKADPESKVVSADTVFIKQMKFAPQEIAITEGSVIVFINQDLVDHNVISENGSWSSPILKPSESWSLTVTASADYICSLHVVMKGRINLRSAQP